jgi:putative transposase
MPNHVHLILTPSDEDGLRAALARTHRRHAGHIHAREKRTGHFWQGRFGCVAMDEAHLAAAVCHVALNPVRARLVERAQDGRWSSVHAHLGLTADDGLTATAPVMERFPDLAARIQAGEDEAMSPRLRRAETICRPLGDAAFVAGLERRTGRPLAPARRGPKPKRRGDGAES